MIQSTPPLRLHAAPTNTPGSQSSLGWITAFLQPLNTIYIESVAQPSYHFSALPA